MQHLARTTVISTLAMLTVALPASATSTYLLQLGSFEDAAQAQQRWADLKQEHSSLNALSLNVARVTLPPDDFVVYRTQAGPVNSREAAQAICAKLNANDDDCYVVETAMFQPSVGGSTVQVAQPNPISRPAPVQAPQIVEPELTMPEIEAPVVPEASAPQILAPSVSAVAVATPVVSAPELDVDTNEPGFFSSLFTFGDDEPEVRRLPEVPVGVDVPAETIVQAQARQMVNASPVAQHVTTPTGMVLPPPPPPSASFGRVQDEPTVAVPPQASISVQQPRIIEPNVNIEPPVVTSQTPVIQAPHVIGGGAIPQQQSLQAGTSNDADVAEAIRVPLSTMEKPEARQQIQTVAPQRLGSVRGFPSQQARQKTMWAQISYFDSQQTALGYWEQFRQTNTGLPPLRVRVTKPYLLRSSSEQRVSLRVGPFDTAADIGRFCSAMQAAKLQCRTMTDLGESATANRPRYSRSQARQQAPFATSRYANRYRGAVPSSMGTGAFWVQLGSYQSPGQAEAAWRSMKDRHASLLGDSAKNIATPQMGSNSRTLYRLRTGPFLEEGAARNLCGQLRQYGQACVVSQGY